MLINSSNKPKIGHPLRREYGKCMFNIFTNVEGHYPSKATLYRYMNNEKTIAYNNSTQNFCILLPLHSPALKCYVTSLPSVIQVET